MQKIRLRIPEYRVDVTVESDDKNMEAISNLIRGLKEPWTYRERTGFNEYKGKKHIIPAFDPEVKIITEKVAD